MIREAIPADAQELVRIANDYTVESPSWVKAGTVFDASHIFRDYAKAFVFEENKKIIGFSMATYFADRCEVFFVVIDPAIPARQRVKPLYALFLALAQEAQRQGIEYMSGLIARDSISSQKTVELWMDGVQEEHDINGFPMLWLKQPTQRLLDDSAARI